MGGGREGGRGRGRGGERPHITCMFRMALARPTCIHTCTHIPIQMLYRSSLARKYPTAHRVLNSGIYTDMYRDRDQWVFIFVGCAGLISR